MGAGEGVVASVVVERVERLFAGERVVVRMSVVWDVSGGEGDGEAARIWSCAIIKLGLSFASPFSHCVRFEVKLSKYFQCVYKF